MTTRTMRVLALPRRANAFVTLVCQPLEDRTTPVTYTVTTLADTSNVQGQFSLRDAIHAATNSPGAALIEFAGSLSGTAVLQTALEPITSDMTIDGKNRIAVYRGPFEAGPPGQPPPPPPKFRIFEVS